MAVRVRACICVSVIKICIEAGDAWYEHETLMALPSLVQLQLHTGGAAGREVEGDANLLWNIADQLLKSITTLDEACAILSGDLQGANNRPQAVNSDVRAAVRLALSKDGQRERLAERVMRAEMALGQGEGLPPDFTTWWSLLQSACQKLMIARSGGTPMSWLGWACRTVVLELVRRNGLSLEKVAERLKADREVVLAAVTQFGQALRYAEGELKKDREVVLAAVSQSGFALCFADPELQKDREVVLAAMSQNGLALQDASEDLKKDREVVLTAVSQNGEALMFLSEELKKDREVVLTAVRSRGRALMYADAELKKDREVVLTAVSQNGDALALASDELKGDREVVLTAVSQNKHAWLFASVELIATDEEIRRLYRGLDR